MGIIEFFSERVGIGSVRIHCFIKYVQVVHITCENIGSDVILNIVKVGVVGVNLIFFPLFIDGLSKGGNTPKKTIEKVVIFRNHGVLHVAIFVLILHPNIDGLDLFVLLNLE